MIKIQDKSGGRPAKKRTDKQKKVVSTKLTELQYYAIKKRRGDPPQRRGILRHAVSADKKRRLDIPCRQTVEQTLCQGAARPVVKRQRHPFFVLRRPHRRG